MRNARVTLSPNDSMAGSFRTIILTCGELGVTVANALAADGASEVVALITAPYGTPRRTLKAKIRHVVRMQGWQGLLALVAGKLVSLGRSRPAPGSGAPQAELKRGIAHIHVSDFHAPESLFAISALRPDLAVIAGTHILKQAVFDLPRTGSINIHMGKVPEYRGAAPAFWELYNGEAAVGITIHRVVASVDAGAVLAQELFPVDPAPEEDPCAYIEKFKREVLLPNGVRMLTETVRALAEGTAREIPQDHGSARTFFSPDHRAIAELRRRVEARRRMRAAQ